MLSSLSANAEWLGYAAALYGAVIACLSLLLPSRSLARVSFGIGMGLIALEILFATLSSGSVSLTEAAGWQGLRLVALSLIPATWLLFSLVFARGNRHEFLSRWWLVLVAALVLPIATVFVLPGQLITAAVVLPTEEGLWFELGTKGLIFQGLLLGCYVLVLVNLERTLRASVGVMRWRIKFVVVGLGLLFVMRIHACSQKLLYHGWHSSTEPLQGAALLAALFLITWSAVRSGLGEADVYPSRKVILGSVTFSMVGVYLVLVGALSKGAALWGGGQSLPLQAIIVLAGLGLLAVFFVSDRARLWLSLILSRHFQRPSYDYRDIWQRFTERTVSSVDPAALCGVGCSFISELFQTLSVTIWIVEQGGAQLRVGGSTTFTEEAAAALVSRTRVSDSAWKTLLRHNELVGVDGPKFSAFQEFQDLCPEQFKHKGGSRFILPLRASDQLVGLLVLSDRVNGRPYSVEERDLLRTLGLEIAAQLLNLRLLERRSDLRETNALRTMSTFFAHDLKNTGSTLSLTLQNLRQHFGNPDFREDALRAVSKSVEHINQIVDGLSLLQSEIKLAVRDEDLNAVVRQVISEMDAALTMEIALDLQPVPAIPLDGQQIKKVLINLLLNAQDAASGGGRVEMQTGTAGQWVSLKVADNGCGMKTEFLRKSLFRPFQTTKKNGLGIGMFQSKLIVESHGGRIEVESQVDVGTTFRVLLPMRESIQ